MPNLGGASPHGHLCLSLLLCCAAYAAGLFACLAPTPGPACDALGDFYDASGGASWNDNSGWVEAAAGSAVDVCGFFGVMCDEDGAAVSLGFARNGLVGTLPFSIANLSTLTAISIQNEPQLEGSLPSTLGMLTSLRSLAVSNTNTNGSVPESLGGLALTSLVLRDMRLSALLGSLPLSLRDLQLVSQQTIYGSPEGFGSLTALTNLQLGFFTFNVPTGSAAFPDLSRLARLTFLQVTHSEISGALPASLGSLSLLTGLELTV